MGFEKELNHVLELLVNVKQCMLFSATLPPWVKNQARKIFPSTPVHLDLINQAEKGGKQTDKTSELVRHIALACPTEAYRLGILASVVQRYGLGRALIFTDTKMDCDRHTKILYER